MEEMKNYEVEDGIEVYDMPAVEEEPKVSKAFVTCLVAGIGLAGVGAYHTGKAAITWVKGRFAKKEAEEPKEETKVEESKTETENETK